MTKHVFLMFKLLELCQKEGYVTKVSMLSIAPIIIGGIALPNILVRVLEKNYAGLLSGPAVGILSGGLLSDKMIKERIDLVIKAISIGGGNEK